MDLLAVRTSAGFFGLAGQRMLDRRRPALLAVAGAFAPRDHLHDLIERFPDANVVVATMPGMWVPWSGARVPQLIQGLQELADWLFGDLPLVTFGASTGGLMTLGLKGPNVCRHVALEPFLQTAPLWPFIADARRRLVKYADQPAVASFLWTLFGVGPDKIENRDYRFLAEGLSAPADIIVGGLPLLPERPTPTWPSFTSEEDRAAFRRDPRVVFHQGPPDSGHNLGSIPGEGTAMVHAVIAAALKEAAARCG
jgi:hypothetical protein